MACKSLKLLARQAIRCRFVSSFALTSAGSALAKDATSQIAPRRFGGVGCVFSLLSFLHLLIVVCKINAHRIEARVLGDGDKQKGYETSL